MILLIDNYDSFTYNLVHYLEELGETVIVKRNDKVSIDEILNEINPDSIVISPGPCDPDKAGICLDVIKELGADIPILGVCLGHQSIAQAYGGEIIRSDKPMHGKVSKIIHKCEYIFDGLKSPLEVTRYHSLIVKKDSLPDCFDITAETENKVIEGGTIMGISHKEHCVHGVQFHPESIASEGGHHILKNFINLARQCSRSK